MCCSREFGINQYLPPRNYREAGGAYYYRNSRAMIEHVADLLESVHIPLPISFADSSTVSVGVVFIFTRY